MQNLLTVGQVARRLQLSEDKVRALADEGTLKAHRTAGGHRRFSEGTVERYERAQLVSAPRRKLTATPKRQSARATAVPIFDDSTDADEETFDEFDDLPEDDILAPRIARPLPPAKAAIMPTNADRQEEEERRRKASLEAARLHALKAHGTASIPYDMPVTVRSAIVEELEAYVTSERLPGWVATWEQQALVRGRVEAIVKAHRQRVKQEAEQARVEAARKDAAEKARRAAHQEAATAKAEAERRIKELVEYGKRYAEDDLQDFEVSDRWELRREIEKALREEVGSDWTERDVEALVDDIFDEKTEDGEESQ